MNKLLRRVVSLAMLVALVFALSTEALAVTYCESRASDNFLTVSTTSGLNVRVSPRTWLSRVVGTIPGGVTVHVKRYSGNWAQIDTGTYDGRWICTDYTTSTWFERGFGQINTNSRCGVYLRRGPSTSFSAITLIPYGARISKLYIASSGWWYVTYTSGRRSYSGWISSQYVKRLPSVTSR